MAPNAFKSCQSAAAAHPLHTADVLSRVLALLGMEHWPAAAQVCHGWRSASVAKAVEWRVLQPDPAAALLTGVPVGAAAVVCVVPLPDGTLCSSDTVRHYVASRASNTLKLFRPLSGRPPRLLRTAGDY